jgi:hypothetical protein
MNSIFARAMKLIRITRTLDVVRPVNYVTGKSAPKNHELGDNHARK